MAVTETESLRLSSWRTSDDLANPVGQSTLGVRATILHISDLHFGRAVWGPQQVNSDLLKQLVCLVKLPTISPNYIVVSGDVVENPSPWAMKKAYDFICELSAEAGVAPGNVLVIPGNHDYKVAGNFGLGRITRIPFDVYFGGNWNVRGSDWSARREWISNQRRQRWSNYFRLLPNALLPRGQKLRDEVITLWDPARDVVIFGIQSTPLFESFAAGRVSSLQISKVAEELQKNKSQWAKAFKVAVVHHHPLPMSYDKADLRGRVEESLMVFYNAGGFLRELSRHGIDLVLHGHKHVAGFRRALYDFEDGTRRSIGVMAAGSATHKNPSDPLGNEFNLIKIYDDETVTIDRWYYAPDIQRKDESHTYHLYDLNDVREHRTKRHYRDFSLKIGRVIRTVNLTRDGFTRVDVHLRDCQVCDEHEPLFERELDLVTERPCYFRGIDVVKEGTSFEFPKIVFDDDSHPWHQKGNFKFGTVVSSKDPAFDLKYSGRLMNGHALTFKEFVRRYGEKVQKGELRYEFSTIECEQPSEVLKLIVNFPDDFDMNTIEASDVKAYYLPRQVGAQPTRRIHSSETRRIKNKLSVEGKSFVLEITSPIPEFLYKISWAYRADAQADEDLVIRERSLEDDRRRLINIARNPCSRPYELIHKYMMTFLEGVLQHYPQTKANEKADVSLIIFDDEKSVLRFTASSFGDIRNLFDETFMTGEGCAGFCFEKSRVVYYDRAREQIGYYLDPDEVSKRCGSSSLAKAEALIAIPWLETPNIPMGVVTIYSREKNSRLLHAMYPNRTNGRRKSPLAGAKRRHKAQAENLIQLTNILGSLILSVLRIDATEEPSPSAGANP